MEAKEITIKIDPTVLDIYNDMNSDMYSDEIKSGLAYKLMKFEFEKKIVDAVMESYKNKEQ